MRVASWPAFKNRPANPYNALLSDALIAQEVDVVEFDPRTVLSLRPDIAHLHWPEAPLNKARRRAAAFRALEVLWVTYRLRRQGTRIVWTAHNLRSHFGRYPRVERVWWKTFLRLHDGWLSLAYSAAAAAMQAHPALHGLPYEVVPLGHFRDAYDDTDRSSARTSLGLAPVQKLVLFLGRVKPYKGVPELVTTFSELADPDLRLLVAGRCDEPSLDQELTRIAVDPRVELRLREVPDAEISTLIRAADLVVLPFRSILNSASALLALSFDTPVLCPALGALGELAETVPGWVTTYDGELSRNVLEAALVRPRPGSRPDLSGFEWEAVAKRTKDFYARLLEAGHPARR
jgi:glycosyltransferase involved in cell wall biosynthesis